MKLIRFGSKINERPGVFLNGVRKDCSSEFGDWDHLFFKNDGLQKLDKFIEKYGDKIPDVHEGERWASCIKRPAMILCVGLNYAAHAIESRMQLPKEPVVFGKAVNTISGPYDQVSIPSGGKKTDYEIELGIVLKEDTIYLENEKQAAQCIAGYCICNDISERAFQLERGGQWIKGKSSPGFCPVGPYLVTTDEAGDIGNLQLQLKVNNVIRQESSTRYMIFKPAYLVYYLSQFMLLEAGDLILSGTPPGVGLGMNPPTYLTEGDIVELSIGNLGVQKQRFVISAKLNKAITTNKI